MLCAFTRIINIHALHKHKRNHPCSMCTKFSEKTNIYDPLICKSFQCYHLLRLAPGKSTSYRKAGAFRQNFSLVLAKVCLFKVISVRNFKEHLFYRTPPVVVSSHNQELGALLFSLHFRMNSFFLTTNVL